MNRTLDARGMACPLPVVNTKKEIETMAAGESIAVLVDNEIAVQNLTKFAQQRNLQVASEKKAEQEFQVVLTLSEAKTKEDSFAGETCIPDQRKKNMLVVISGNTMGLGEEQLGKALMKAFVFALTKQDQLPDQILLYNSGAFLSCEGSESLEDLKQLEAQGVEIVTCGTCLNYYGLSEKLGVGSVTNMYDIVERMEHATSVIRP